MFDLLTAILTDHDIGFNIKQYLSLLTIRKAVTVNVVQVLNGPPRQANTIVKMSCM